MLFIEHRDCYPRKGEVPEDPEAVGTIGKGRVLREGTDVTIVALAWLVNELRAYADGIAAGQFVTTGTCVVPVPIHRGDTVRVDFGDFGTAHVQLL